MVAEVPPAFVTVNVTTCTPLPLNTTVPGLALVLVLGVAFGKFHKYVFPVPEDVLLNVNEFPVIH